VRGYLESEVLGDNGIIGSLELRSPALAQNVSPKISDWRFFGFIEGGSLSIYQPLPQQQSIFDLASFGAGTRIKLLDHLNGQVDVAVPMHSEVATHAYNPRIEFRLWADF
jgi:hemolysin activation/secretion protein